MPIIVDDWSMIAGLSPKFFIGIARYGEERPDNCTESEQGLWVMDTGQVWIPSPAHKLTLCIITASHAAMMGRRGVKSTLVTIAKVYWWNGMEADVAS